MARPQYTKPFYPYPSLDINDPLLESERLGIVARLPGQRLFTYYKNKIFVVVAYLLEHYDERPKWLVKEFGPVVSLRRPWFYTGNIRLSGFESCTTYTKCIAIGTEEEWRRNRPKEWFRGGGDFVKDDNEHIRFQHENKI